MLLQQDILKKIKKHITTVHEEKKHSDVVFLMLICEQNIQTKNEKHIKTIHEEKKHSNAVFAMLIS